MLKKLTASITAFAMMFQVASPAVAAMLPDNVIEVDLNSNPEFERVYNDDHQFQASSYLQGSELTATNLKSFYDYLKQNHVHTLGEPTYVPIDAGDITTFIPVYDEHKLVGDSLVQSRYVRAQIQAVLGRSIIDSDLPEYQDEATQLNTLYNNAIDHINANPNLLFGQQLNLDQAASGLAKDIIWPELRTINGEQVIVPVVYITAETYAARAVTYHQVQFNGAVSFNQLTVDDVEIQFGRNAFLNVARDLINGGTLTATDDLQIVVGGTLQNLSGIIQSTGDLKIGAHSINSETLVHRYDFGGEQGGRFGEISEINSINGDVTLRSYSDILIQGGHVNAGNGNITFAADGSIKIGSAQLATAFEGYDAGWYVNRSNVDHLTSSLTAEDTIKLIANGEIKIDAAEIISDQGHIELLAGLGITIEDDFNVTQSQTQGRFKKTSIDTSVYKTVAMRALLDAGKGLRLHSELGDITLRAADIRTNEGASVSAKNGAVSLLMTTETDHYSYSEVKKGMFTVKTTNQGHNIETGVPNTVMGGLAVEAFKTLQVEYEGDSSLTLDEQITKLSEFDGLSWMADVRANTADVDWTAIELQYEEWNETNTSLSPAFAAVISIAVAIATSGTSTGWLDAAMNAGMTSLASQATIALANGIVNGDVSQALDDLASSDTFKNIAVSMVTAGALAKLDEVFFSTDTEALDAAAEAKATAIANNATQLEIQAAVDAAIKKATTVSLTAQAGQAVMHATVQAGMSTAILGGDFSDQFKQALVQQGIDALGQYMAEKIGEAFDHNKNPTGLDTALKYISHAGAGCIVGVVTAENSGQADSSAACASGAGGAVIGEAIATQYRSNDEILGAKKALDDFMKDNAEYISQLADLGYTRQEINSILSRTTDLNHYTSEINKLKQQGVDLARLGAAIGAFAAGADAAGINIASDLGANAAENNALFLLVALPVVLTAIDIALTGADLVEIYEAYERGDTTEGNRLLAIFAGTAAIGAAIPGDKILSEIIEYAAKNGKHLGDNASAILEYVRDRVSPNNSTSAPDVPVSGPGSIEHKSTRWQEYQDRGGEWDYERWSKTYDNNMVRATKAHKVVDDYHSQLSWGDREVTVNVGNTDQVRRLDIADPQLMKGIEVKSGYITHDETIRSELVRDRVLVENGWDISWHFDGTASKPLLNALDEAGIPWTFKDPSLIPKRD